MPAHSRSKNGVASLAYVAGIHVFAVTSPDEAVAGMERSGMRGRAPDFAALHPGYRPPPHPDNALAAMFTTSATSVALKKNDTTPCAMTVRRIALAVTATSETCDVIPMTSEKYMKSQ
jgi:hypothetical protein